MSGSTKNFKRRNIGKMILRKVVKSNISTSPVRAVGSLTKVGERYEVGDSADFLHFWTKVWKIVCRNANVSEVFEPDPNGVFWNHKFTLGPPRFRYYLVHDYVKDGLDNSDDDSSVGQNSSFRKIKFKGISNSFFEEATPKKKGLVSSTPSIAPLRNLFGATVETPVKPASPPAEKKKKAKKRKNVETEEEGIEPSTLGDGADETAAGDQELLDNENMYLPRKAAAARG